MGVSTSRQGRPSVGRHARRRQWAPQCARLLAKTRNCWPHRCRALIHAPRDHHTTLKPPACSTDTAGTLLTTVRTTRRGHLNPPTYVIVAQHDGRAHLLSPTRRLLKLTPWVHPCGLLHACQRGEANGKNGGADATKADNCAAKAGAGGGLGHSQGWGGGGTTAGSPPATAGAASPSAAAAAAWVAFVVAAVATAAEAGSGGRGG